ncbi:CoA transferase [Phycobium rhodophyticola]
MTPHNDLREMNLCWIFVALQRRVHRVYVRKTAKEANYLCMSACLKLVVRRGCQATDFLCGAQGRGASGDSDCIELQRVLKPDSRLNKLIPVNELANRMEKQMTATGPLSHLRIVEMAGLGPCPLAGQLMADLGAQVVVIDRASGPKTRRR